MGHRYLAVAVARATGAICGGCKSNGATTAKPAASTTPQTQTVVANIKDTTAKVPVRSTPDAAGSVIVTLPGLTSHKAPLVLDVVQTQPGWLRVVLPTRPNGGEGWVQADPFTLRQVQTAIDVDLTARKIVITFPERSYTGTVGIGAPATKTPVTGASLAYVSEVLKNPNPAGAYGPYALGLSLHSATLTEFAGGDGQVAIHGTNDPASVGKDVTHGCVRVGADLAQVLGQVPVGTPVVIH